jgi:uncharacterized heparinase superfamily protein
MASLALVRRYWHTIRYLRLHQVVARLRLRAGAAWRARRPLAAAARYRARAASAGLTLADDPWRLRGVTEGDLPIDASVRRRLAAQTAEAMEGRFTFLHETAGGDGEIDWQANGASQLWRYHLHYFDYLPEAVLASQPWADVERLALDWIARNPLGGEAARDAWHPYVVSLRVTNWMLTMAMAPRGQPISHDWQVSLLSQVVFIERNLETDVGGNHLLKNLKALALAGCFCTGSGADRLRSTFVRQFTDEVARQLRSDGGHYEQSPMYHAQVLVDAAEVALGLRLSGLALPEALNGCLGRMSTFLGRVCHPDGQIAQFGDSAFNMTPTPAEVMAVVDVARGGRLAGPVAPRHAPLVSRFGRRKLSAATAAPAAGDVDDFTTATAWDPQASGFEVLASRDRRYHLIADLGPVCPDDLPAHAHSDLFGFEVSVDGQRVIVDSGVSEYRAGPWRDYERSTRAHSTVMVDGHEQSECWGSFRVAERAHVVAGRRFATPHARGVVAAHDGYERLAGPVRHSRAFTFVGERAWLVVDWLDGAGSHEWETYLHAHPEVDLVPSPGGGWILVRRAARLRVLPFGEGETRIIVGCLDPRQGWYAPDFGRRQPAPVLIRAATGRLPVNFGWLLVPDSPDHISVDVRSDRLVRVKLGSQTFDVPLTRLTSADASTRHG